MDTVERFAAEAIRFQQWVRQGTDQGEVAAREALLRITHLYVAALELPPARNDEPADPSGAERVGDLERQEVLNSCRRLPFDYYGEVFNPLPVPPEEPVAGSLADDIADIYGDAIRGLRAHQAGRRTQAIWEWGFGLQSHWGEHATGAIRALHCWLAANAPDRLAAAEPTS
jgi:hypothetical protein